MSPKAQASSAPVGAEVGAKALTPREVRAQERADRKKFGNRERMYINLHRRHVLFGLGRLRHKTIAALEALLDDPTHKDHMAAINAVLNRMVPMREFLAGAAMDETEGGAYEHLPPHLLQQAVNVLMVMGAVRPKAIDVPYEQSQEANGNNGGEPLDGENDT